MVLQALFADASNWTVAQAPKTRATRAPVQIAPAAIAAAVE
jgi:UDP-3-O-[3-hydroxymyristoyl] N-acetylglucosamine deacetylase